MDTITSGGLRHAVAVYNRHHSNNYNFQQTVAPAMRRDVIIVGAGVAGLSAAYELAQIGHNVLIIEAQDRVGGRIKTMRKPFADGLHCEAGAMRLPPNHYLTKHYVDLFKIKTRKFQNYQERGFLYMYGERITMKEWTDDNRFWSTHWWPGWDANLSEENKASVNGILDLYDRTMAPVKNELGTKPTTADWQKWFQKWSKVSFGQFLRFAEINPKDDGGLRPWPEAAITAYTTSTYTPTLGDDVASTLREELGGWWRNDLYTPVDGMDTIPNGFLAPNQYGWNKEVCLSKNIMYDVKVSGVEEFPSQANGRNDRIRVKGVNTKTGEPYTAEGHAVILTVTLPILRQLNVPLSTEKQKAMADITYGASTRILLQCKTRFWQRGCGQGGFSKTNLVIGQLHYPDYDQSGIPDFAPGILLVYTWAENATILAAQPEEMAIESALDEISKIHPEIRDEFEVGYVQAWSTDKYSQGAYAQLKPFEYLDSLDKLTTSTDTIYLAGEALSWTNGWQQGAFFSALAQAFAFENKLENGTAPMYRPFKKLI